MRKALEIGGMVAAVVLIAFGVVAIVMGFNGRNTVNNSLKNEYIVGTPDMNATAIAAEAKKAGLPASIALPTANIAGKPITSGKLAREFATCCMRIPHVPEATGGLTRRCRTTPRLTARARTTRRRPCSRTASP